MSEFTNVQVGKQTQEFDVSPQFQPYSGVEIATGRQDEDGNDLVYFAGDNSGRTLHIENPWGTQAQAENILASLVARGLQYQPYTATNAIVNPAAELGDGVTINGTHSGIYKISRNYSSLMTADIEAPQDEEVDHEYPYEPKQDRIYKRELGEAKAEIRLTQEQIESEVTRASEAEGQLSSRITQNANSISSEVTARNAAINELDSTLTSKIEQTASNISATVEATNTRVDGKLDSTRSNESFGWWLTSSSFTIKSNGARVFVVDHRNMRFLTETNKKVFEVNSEGLTIDGSGTFTGKITAKSGEIGGFTIGSSAIYSGMNNLNSTAYGVYVGTNGISVGGGKFKVTSSGAVSAVDMTLTGTLRIGGTQISAAALRNGAANANAWATNGTATNWSTGSRYGFDFNNATKQNTAQYPAYFRAGSISANSFATNGQMACGSLFVSPYYVVWKEATIGGVTIRYLGRS